MALTDPTGHGMEFYVPHSRGRAGGFYSILVRTAREPEAAIAMVKQAVWSLDPTIPFNDASSMSQRLAESLYSQRFFLRLSAAFTAIALSLAAVGVYGAFAYWVARRRRELAIRMAVGASPQAILISVLRRSMRLATIGAAVGLTIAWSGSHVVKSMLFETDPRDPVILVTITILLTAAAMAACLVPALRAGRVDPMSTLRAD